MRGCVAQPCYRRTEGVGREMGAGLRFEALHLDVQPREMQPRYSRDADLDVQHLDVQPRGRGADGPSSAARGPSSAAPLPSAVCVEICWCSVSFLFFSFLFFSSLLFSSLLFF